MYLGRSRLDSAAHRSETAGCVGTRSDRPHDRSVPVGQIEGRRSVRERVGDGLGPPRQLPDRDLEHLVRVELAHEPGELGVGETRDEKRQPLAPAVVAFDRSAAEHAHERADHDSAAEAESNDNLDACEPSRPGVRHLRLPQRREVGRPADQRDQERDEDHAVQGLRPPAEQRDRRRYCGDPHRDRHEAAAEELQQLRQVATWSGDLESDRVGDVGDDEQREQHRKRSPPRRQQGAERADGKQGDERRNPRETARPGNPVERDGDGDALSVSLQDDVLLREVMKAPG